MSNPTRMILSIVFGLVASACVEITPVKSSNSSLKEHTQIFKQRVEKVGENVYVAIGFGLANSIMIEGKDGLIIVDTMESREAATKVLTEFRKITPKPIKAIIYTHNHADHILGADVFASESSTAIYAHSSLLGFVNRIVNELRPVTEARASRMFGNFLNSTELENAGIGPFLGVSENSTIGFLAPTKTFEETLDAEVAGVKFRLVHAPGETDDQLFVWLPKEKILLCGDNYYWTFPNLYTIRGTPFRSLRNWYKSLDKMRDLKPVFLVPSHTHPIKGENEVHTVLTNYRDAIQFVHDQSIRGINQGLTPDELAERLTLPEHLAKLPYLQPFYGTVSWSTRAMFSGNLGWFDGDSAHLQPLSRNQHAQMLSELAGGNQSLLNKAEKYLSKGDAQAALELTSQLALLDLPQEKVRSLRIKSLIKLAENEQNPNARHYYLTEAKEIQNGKVFQLNAKPSSRFLNSIPLEGFFDSMPVNLDPVKSKDMKKSVGIHFSDEDKSFVIQIRRGIAEVRQVSGKELKDMPLDIEVVANSKVWREILAKTKNPIVALGSFDYPRGNSVSFASFLQLFEPPEAKLPFEKVK